MSLKKDVAVEALMYINMTLCVNYGSQLLSTSGE